MDLTTLTSLYTVTAFYVAWLVFFVERRSRLDQKRSDKLDILKSIEQELLLMKSWLGVSYDDNNYNSLQDPWHPFHMVYGLIRNDAIKSALSVKSVTLLSKDLLSALVLLNQQLGSFEQHVNRLVQFNSSNPVLATKTFYYYDSNFAKYNRTQKWNEFENLAKKLSKGKRVTDEQMYLIGSTRILKDLHVIGIGSEYNPFSLRSAYLKTIKSLEQDLTTIKSEKQFIDEPIFIFLDTMVLGSFIVLPLAWFFAKKGGDFMSYVGFGVIALVSIVFGIIKYGSIADKHRGSVWQLKAQEIWNDIVNFFLTGMVGYYFVLVRLPKLLSGEALLISDFGLFLIFILGVFGHLCVLSKNVTDGIEVVLRRILER